MKERREVRIHHTLLSELLKIVGGGDLLAANLSKELVIMS